MAVVVPLRVIVSHQTTAGLGELMDGLGVVLHRLLEDLVLLQHGHGALFILQRTQIKPQQEIEIRIPDIFIHEPPDQTCPAYFTLAFSSDIMYSSCSLIQASASAASK